MPRKTVTHLYAEFEKALHNLETCAYPHDGTGKRKYDAAVDVCTTLCDRIIATPANPANPIPEMLLKIDAADWSEGHVDGDCLASLRKDLKTMRAAPRRALTRTRRPERVTATPAR